MNNSLQAKLDKINNQISDMEWALNNAPENLYCDGERSHAEVQAEFRDLYRERSHLEVAIKNLKK